MRIARRLLLALAACLAPLLAAAQSGGSALTWRAQVADDVLLVRAASDGQLTLHHLGTGRSLSVATFATPAGLGGVLPTGEVVSLGNVLGRPHLLVGATLLPLAPIGAAEYAAALRPAPRGAAGETRREAAAASGGGARAHALGGTALLYARSRNGYGQVRRFDLCSDGRFFYRFEELQSSQLGNAAGARTDAGTWTLQGERLTLRFEAQGERTYTLQPRSASSVSLDGTVFAVERSGRCG